MRENVIFFEQLITKFENRRYILTGYNKQQSLSRCPHPSHEELELLVPETFKASGQTMNIDNQCDGNFLIAPLTTTIQKFIEDENVEEFCTQNDDNLYTSTVDVQEASHGRQPKSGRIREYDCNWEEILKKNDLIPLKTFRDASEWIELVVNKDDPAQSRYRCKYCGFLEKINRDLKGYHHST